jgi:hypothetical protein
MIEGQYDLQDHLVCGLIMSRGVVRLASLPLWRSLGACVVWDSEFGDLKPLALTRITSDLEN